MMQLDLLAAASGGFAACLRRFDQRGAEYLQLEQRGSRATRCADVLRVPKRVLAALAAQRVVRRTSRGARLVRAATLLDEEGHT